MKRALAILAVAAVFGLLWVAYEHLNTKSTPASTPTGRPDANDIRNLKIN